MSNNTFSCMFCSDMAAKQRGTLSGPRLFLFSLRVFLQPDLGINYVQLWQIWALPLLQRWWCVSFTQQHEGIASASSWPQPSVLLRKVSRDTFFLQCCCCCAACCHDSVNKGEGLLWRTSKHQARPLCFVFPCEKLNGRRLLSNCTIRSGKVHGRS